MGTSVFHGCTFRQAGVIADPEQEDDLELEHPVGVAERLGVVYSREPICFPPQQLVYKDRHESSHTRWIPR